MDRVTLTGEQIAQFRERGYLAVPSLTDAEDVEFLRAAYDRIFADKAGRAVGDQFDLAGTDEEGAAQSLPQILYPAKYAPEMNRSRLLANATAVARQLLGPEAECEFAHAIFKPPAQGAETPWHQDAAYWSPELRYRSVSIWVPLQEATLENGCMQFVPGSHRLDIVPHRSINNDPRIHGLELTPEAMDRVREVVSCPLLPGGATFHGPYMLHHTPPNRSSIPRRALILNAGLPPEPRATLLRFAWAEQRTTERDRRAREAAERGLDVSGPPTGELRKS